MYAYDAEMCTLAMQYLPPPHVVLRYGYLDGNVYPHVAHMVRDRIFFAWPSASSRFAVQAIRKRLAPLT